MSGFPGQTDSFPVGRGNLLVVVQQRAVQIGKQDLCRAGEIGCLLLFQQRLQRLVTLADPHILFFTVQAKVSGQSARLIAEIPAARISVNVLEGDLSEEKTFFKSHRILLFHCLHTQAVRSIFTVRHLCEHNDSLAFIL